MSCSSTRIRRLQSVSTGRAPRCTDSVASLCSDEPSLERVSGLSGTGSSDQYLITKHMASYLMASEGHVLHWMRVFRISFLRFQTCHTMPPHSQGPNAMRMQATIWGSMPATAKWMATESNTFALTERATGHTYGILYKDSSRSLPYV